MLTKELTDDQVVSAFNDWDESEASDEERSGFTHAQQRGESLCTFYCFETPCGFKWSQTSAAEIFEVVTRLPWGNSYICQLRDEGVGIDEILQGIEFFRLKNEDASNWVRTILNAYASAYDPMEASTSGGDILEWLDGVTWEMPELMRRRLESPVLFGLICIELERYLEGIQFDREDSEKTLA